MNLCRAMLWAIVAAAWILAASWVYTVWDWLWDEDFGSTCTVLELLGGSRPRVVPFWIEGPVTQCVPPSLLKDERYSRPAYPR